MAFGGKVNQESVRKLGSQLRLLERKAGRRKARSRRARRRAEYYQEDEAVDTGEQETYLDRWKQKRFSWF